MLAALDAVLARLATPAVAFRIPAATTTSNSRFFQTDIALL
uniref:Uncharacterized protein n=1 Tax=viral metagenome TaxID=1070528 RepID=A0A6C0HLS3_9ZZZZ